MNVSLGTFGAGVPEYCPECKVKGEYDFIADNWKDINGEWLSTSTPKIDLLPPFAQSPRDN